MSREVVQSDFLTKKEDNAFGSQFAPVLAPYQINRRALQTGIGSGSPANTMTMYEHDATTNFSDEKIVIKRVSLRKKQDPEKVSLSKSKYMDLKRTFIAEYVNVNTTDVAKVQLCIDLVSYDVEIRFKYEELDFQALLDKNMVRRRINCLTQALGILEKYASNLIKPNRPTFWRQVKFTSSLVKTYLENVHGSYDILKQMGYTKVVPDGLAFADEVRSPNVEKVKLLAAELFLAKYESDELVHKRHPYLEIKAFTGPVNSAAEKIQETVNSEDSESEFYDAEDGLSTINESNAEILQKGGSMVQNQEKEHSADDKQCHVCGENKVKFMCKECDEFFCEDCVKRFHGNRKRQSHVITEIKRTSGEELKRGSPPIMSYENYSKISKPEVPPRQQSVGKTIKRPIPTPRKRIPSGVKLNERPASSSQAFETVHPASVTLHPSFPDELPPPQVYSRQRLQPEFPRNALRETIPRQPSCQGEREIKRPPPFDEPSAFAKDLQEESIYESLKMPSEHIYETLVSRDGITREGPIVPQTPPPQHKQDPVPSVTSCPSCYCINEENVTNCVACGTPLLKLQQTLPGRIALSNLAFDNEENNRFNMPQARSEHLPGIPAGYYDNQSYESHVKPQMIMPEKPIPGTTTSSYPRIQAEESKKWECSHCTFHNDMGTKICAMCSKTTDNPVEVQFQDQMTSQSTAATQFYSPAVSSSRNMSQVNDPISVRAISTSTAYNPVSFQQLGTARAQDPISPQSVSMSTAYHLPGTSSEDSPNSAKSGCIPPSYIKLQQDELTSLQSKQPNSSPEIVSLQQQEKEIISHKLLQQTRETAQQLQIPVVASSPHVPSPTTPPVHVLSNDQLSSGHSSGYGSQERVMQYLEMEELKRAGRQFVKLLKEAETLGFSAEELNIAYNLQQDESLGPIYWLQTEWFDRMQEVMIRFTNISSDENYGNVSPQEARNALTEHTGDVKQACEKCIKDRKEKLDEVMKSGFYIRTDAIKALDINEGDVELAIQQLQRMTFEPMLQKIKDNCIDDYVDNRKQPQVARQQSTTQDDEIFEAIVSDKEIDMERRIRVMFAEKSFVSWGRASTAIKLIDKNFPVSDSIEAAKVNGDLQRSIQYLQRQCNICFEHYPESRMVTMLNCQCRFCQDCTSRYFSQVIHEQNIMKLVCPQCSEPKNLEDTAIAAEYFNNIDILIRRCVDRETHDLFQRKLRDRTLMKEPNFRWCSHCSSGFINEQPDILKMACPNCKKYSCFQCKKEWEDQHDDISCEQFAAWKEANDPEAQANGLAAHLKQNGIECPNCKFRYDLAKGGCMHFKCGQCSHEFCSGCYQPFRHNQHCPVSASCAKRGLHAHHPRDCLFHLRDRNPNELKKLLDDNNVQYNTEPPQRQAAADDEVQGAAAAVDTGRCKVMEQRETGDGLQDVECGRETFPGYAGLCRLHFSEYLVERINSSFIDPAGIFDINDVKAELARNDLPMPEKQRREKNKAYQTRLIQHVQEKLPLPRKTPRRRVLDIDDRVPCFPPGMQALDGLNQLRIDDLEQNDLYMDADAFEDEQPLSDFEDRYSGAEESDSN